MGSDNKSARESSRGTTINRSEVSKGAAILGYVLVVAAMVGCCVLYFKGTFVNFLSIFYLTGYGVLSLSYYAMTTIFAFLNRVSVNRRVKELSGNVESHPRPSVSIHVVGYRENPSYFRACLESVKSRSYSNTRAIVVAIDGNDAEDMYMADIARDVFGEGVVHMRLSYIPSATSEGLAVTRGQESGNSDSSSGPTVYLVTQPHAGKREAIYTCYLVSEAIGTEFFIHTDSDTIMQPTALDEMVYMAIGNEDVDAVAGQLKIFNKKNVLTYLTAARYFMAFNIERAAQGFHGVVGCISGPLGLYRLSAVKNVIDEWVHQEFMGKKCTFGDDRHMTNKLLSMGGSVVYTHRSVADTETPEAYSRLVAQQTRWSKSYWRELVLQSGWVTRSWYLMLETVYGLLFPVLITATLLTVIFSRTWWSLAAILTVTFALPLIRALVVFVIFEHNPLVFLNVLYPVVYFTTLLPVKFMALLTVGQNEWGTSSRKKIVYNYAPVVPIFLWIAVVTTGVVWHAVR